MTVHRESDEFGAINSGSRFGDGSKLAARDVDENRLSTASATGYAVHFSDHLFKKCGCDTINIVAAVRSMGKGCFFQASIKTFNANEATSLTAFAKSLLKGSTVQTVTVPDRVIVLERRCFADCAALRNIQFGTGSQLSENCEFAFHRSRIQQFTITPLLTTIDGTAFANMPSNFQFHVERNHPVFLLDLKQKFLCEKMTENTESTTKRHKRAVRFIGADSIVSLASFIDAIGPVCFYGSDQLKVVNLEASQLIKVEERGFTGTMISEIILPRTVVTIGANAFPFECRVCEISPSPEFENLCLERLIDPSLEFGIGPIQTSSFPSSSEQ
jgi:hypothetical protein